LTVPNRGRSGSFRDVEIEVACHDNWNTAGVPPRLRQQLGKLRTPQLLAAAFQM
jgi:hypothetical protein